MIDIVYRNCGQKETVIFCDRIMSLGFREAFKAGISFGKDDMVVPESKPQVHRRNLGAGEGVRAAVQRRPHHPGREVQQGRRRLGEMLGPARRGDDGGHLGGAQGRARPRQADQLDLHDVAFRRARFADADAPARRHARPDGEALGRDHREPDHLQLQGGPVGSRVLQFDPRRPQGPRGHRAEDRELGLSDASSRRRRAGFDHHHARLRLERGISMRAIIDAGTVVASLASRILGRTSAETLRDADGKVIVEAGKMIVEEDMPAINAAGIQEVKIRSVLTCEAKNGVCGACYGRDLARGTPVNMGEAVGVIAAQSIGEPGTQLTMRTFHIGGAAQLADQSFIESNFDGEVKIRNRNLARNSNGDLMAMARNVAVVITDRSGAERAVHRVQYGARLKVDEGDKIKRGQRIAEWDPFTRPILTEIDGEIGFEDLVEGVSMSEQVDEATGIAKRIVIDWRSTPRTAGLKPALVIKGKDGKIAKLPARRRRALRAVGRIDHLVRAGRDGARGRRHRAHLDQQREDPRHHGRSAARGGAVRGAPAEGSRDHRRNLRHDTVRERLQEQAAPDHRAERGGRRGGRVPDPEVEAHPPSGRRRDREGRVYRRRQSRPARHSRHQGRRGAGRLSRQRDSGGLPAAGRAASTTSTSR